jgi:cytochrome c553
VAVLQQRLRGLIATFALAACAETEHPAEPLRYLTEPAFRRETLTASLVAPQTPYAQRRLARYETGAVGDWARLPEWNPPSRALRVDGAPSSTPHPLTVSEAAGSGDLDALRALGEAAFWTYPAQLAPSSLARAAGDPATLTAHGIVVQGGAAVGLRAVTLPDRSEGVAMTCATCHAGRDAQGFLRAGLANESLDLGGLAARDADTPALAARLRAWGAGRVDVSTDDGSEPVALPDLRAVRFQRYLHRAGAVAQGSLSALAVRVETLLITSLHESVRPPREVALGLAVYLWSLGEPIARRGDAGSEGARVFAAQCARCHGAEGLSGGLIDATEVGTDPATARSVERGTGAYRVPSLRGLGDRGALLHDGAAASVRGLFDPERLSPGYTAGRRGAGPVAGHRYGLDLPSPQRAALVAYLATL